MKGNIYFFKNKYILVNGMQIIERTEKEQKKYERTKKMEELKRKWTLLKAKLLGGKISPDDSRTLQVHRDAQGNARDYYVSNPYLQDNSAFIAVNPIVEDYEKNRFVYRGIIQGADNAIGVIEANVPLSEIVASPDGNTKLQEMLSEENAEKIRDQYYKSIGEELGPLKGHMAHFGKPDFVLGTILKGEKGQYTYNSQIAEDIEELLQQERESLKKQKLMRDKDSVVIDAGGGLVVSEQECWMEQGKDIQFAGINRDALYYRYMPKAPIQTEDNKYVYIGKTQIGQATKVNQKSGEPIQFVSPDVYENVVIWTEGKNLVQYFLDKKFAGLNFVLGETFTNFNIEKVEEGKELQKYLGGITIDENGECQKVENIPETVKNAVESYLEKMKDEQEKSNIIKFNPRNAER